MGKKSSKDMGITYGEYLLGEGKKEEYREYKKSERYEEGENFRQGKSTWKALESVAKKETCVSYEEHKRQEKIKNERIREQRRTREELRVWSDSKTGAWMQWMGEMENEGRVMYLCTFIFPKFQGGIKNTQEGMKWCEEQIRELYSRILCACVWSKDIHLMKRRKELGRCPFMVVAPEMASKFKPGSRKGTTQLHYHGILALHGSCRYLKHEGKDGIGIVELLESKGGMRTLKFADVQIKKIEQTSLRAVHYALKRGIDNVLAFPVFEGKDAIEDESAINYDRIVKGEFENRRLGGVFKDGIASKRKAELIPAEPLIRGIEFSEGYSDIKKEKNVIKKDANSSALAGNAIKTVRNKRLDKYSSAISRKMIKVRHVHG